VSAITLPTSIGDYFSLVNVQSIEQFRLYVMIPQGRILPGRFRERGHVGPFYIGGSQGPPVN
jgi:hypothetical protein